MFFTWDIKFSFTYLSMKVLGTILNLCYKTHRHRNNNEQYLRYLIFLLELYFLIVTNFILVLFYYCNTYWWKPKLSNELLDLSRIHIQYLQKLGTHRNTKLQIATGSCSGCFFLTSLQKKFSHTKNFSLVSSLICQFLYLDSTTLCYQNGM